MAIWLLTIWLGPPSSTPIEPGGFSGPIILTTDVFEGRYGRWAMGRISAGFVLVELETDAGRGDQLTAEGTIGGGPGTAAGREYGAVLRLRSVSRVDRSEFLPHRAGRFIRREAMERLEPFDDGRALLAGFLIGETSRISDADVDAMRASGLAHFVAVSGSNVALFLALLTAAAGPLALGPRRRALVGLLGLPIYAAATRFEPSVLRASVMAGLALSGRLIGIVLEAWQLLSLAVATLVILDPGLTSNAGFQLSVAATAGVLVGARWPVSGIVRRALAVTLGAQLAVAPLLIAHFGSVPALSPLVNLIAAPLVAGATVVGAIGVAGVSFLVGPAAWLSGLVLSLARGAAGWPQLSVSQLGLVVVGCLALVFLPRARRVLVVLGAGGLILGLLWNGQTLTPGSVAVLDVGQGDAILVDGGGGHFALVDGGPEPAVLMERLRRYGVTSLELVVLTHVHADHATGLTGLVGRFQIGEVWAVTEPHSTTAWQTLMEALNRHSVPVSSPEPGETRVLGVLGLRVEGPLRHYASPNDQSIVLTVSGSTRNMLLAGDIETHAQGELEHLRADVLKVPHQGGATSDPRWLSSVGATTAVISVGPNQFGHPADWVIDVLEQSGATVLRTDEVGDVIVDLGE